MTTFILLAGYLLNELSQIYSRVVGYPVVTANDYRSWTAVLRIVPPSSWSQSRPSVPPPGSLPDGFQLTGILINEATCNQYLPVVQASNRIEMRCGYSPSKTNTHHRSHAFRGFLFERHLSSFLVHCSIVQIFPLPYPSLDQSVQHERRTCSRFKRRTVGFWSMIITVNKTSSGKLA